MDNITFEQLPQAVSLLIEKVRQLADKVEEALGNTTQQKGRRLLGLDDVATLLGKSASTIYTMTSEKRIPYHKGGTNSISLKMKLSGGLSREELRAWAMKISSTGGSKHCATAKDANRVRYRQTTNNNPYENRRFNGHHRTT